MCVVGRHVRDLNPKCRTCNILTLPDSHFNPYRSDVELNWAALSAQVDLKSTNTVEVSYDVMKGTEQL